MLTTYRRAYNLAVHFYKAGLYKLTDRENVQIDVKNIIRQQVKLECESAERVYNSNVVNEAVREAKKNFKEICKKNKKKKQQKESQERYSVLNFKSCKEKIQTWRLDRCPVSFMPCKNEVGELFITEKIERESVGKAISVTLDHGEWYLNVVKHIDLRSENQGEVKCVAVDPGSRTFATCYSESELIIAGERFSVEKLLPLAKSLRKTLSWRDKLKNLCFKEKDEQGNTIYPQWYTDRLRYLENQVDQLYIKKRNLVKDLHQKLAYYLVSHYDVILLPTFETKAMVKKGKRCLNRTAVKNMLNLNHYAFKLMLKWVAKKYRKIVLDVNESHTSKTYSWSGFVNDRLGSRKQIKDEGMIVDRDVNGSRGILIKHLAKMEY